MKRTTDLTAWGTMTGRGEGSFFFCFYSALPVCSLAAGADDNGRRRSAVSCSSAFLAEKPFVCSTGLEEGSIQGQQGASFQGTPPLA